MHRRGSSTSTVRVAPPAFNDAASQVSVIVRPQIPIRATLWVHGADFSAQDLVVHPNILQQNGIEEGSLIEIVPVSQSAHLRDQEGGAEQSGDTDHASVSDFNLDDAPPISDNKCLCIVRAAPMELVEKHPDLEVSLIKMIAGAFEFHNRMHVTLLPTDYGKWTATHVELSFRDAYLSRADMWRLASQELAGKTLYKGQKISFLNSMKVTVKSMHVQGHRQSTCFFARTTIPIFRSEAARYMIFIQMSREMWDFDSEGNGEIMFNRVINGFLPDLFRRWAELEVRHLVSIVLFGRLEYDRYDFGDSHPTATTTSQSSSASNLFANFYQDFYRVVVTDMASAQWTTILNELKRDFRVFLRDMNLHKPTPPDGGASTKSEQQPKITGRPSSALKGNILEAISVASSQFANDYLDRDLIRTGVSTVVITAGTGVFDVDRDLLNLTSESLTNNGIGIDLVCLSRMPLHSVPLFRYRLPQPMSLSRVSSNISGGSEPWKIDAMHHSLPSAGHSPAYSSFTSTSANYFSRFPSAFPAKIAQQYGCGVPQWIDLSYWAPEDNSLMFRMRKKYVGNAKKHFRYSHRPFLPRVRMYELQMMGIMELGMADISIPYLNEAEQVKPKKLNKPHSERTQVSMARSLSRSPKFFRKELTAPHIAGDNHRAGLQSSLLLNAFGLMDSYDDTVFRTLGSSYRPQKKDKVNVKIPAPLIRQMAPSPPLPTGGETDRFSGHETGKPSNEISLAEVQKGKNVMPPGTKPPRISRTISYALRGLAPPMRTAATPTINTESVKAQPSSATTSHAHANAPINSRPHRTESVFSSEQEQRSIYSRDGDTRSVLSSETANENTEKPSAPISIASPIPRPSDSKKIERDHPLMEVVSQKDNLADGRFDQSIESSLRSLASNNDDSEDLHHIDVRPESIPRGAVPFIRNVDPSNPLKRHPKAESAFGRWQHLYPRKPRASKVKWRSLCTPASVPLTTEDFPSEQDLADEYDQKEHSVSLQQYKDSTEMPYKINDLVQEMIALRLAHGYQIVTGPDVRSVVGKGLCDAKQFFDPEQITTASRSIFMSMGKTLQRLNYGDNEHVKVTKYVRRTPHAEFPFTRVYDYHPNIKTILAAEYITRPMELKGFDEEYPWESADDYLANAGLGQDEKANELRFWRARFVLLPVEPPSGTYRPQQHSEENEEEIHLLGIRALTQMWQKSRLIPLGDRQTAVGRGGPRGRREANPLEVKFETLNPSEFVATELDKLLQAEEQGGDVSTTQLLPETEKLDRDTPMPKLAREIQGDRGIEIKNRRWHLRLHYNCFQGEELTNWLFHNVKNIETRDEAVLFGNEIMKEGLFEHVNGRHNFKDGNYFYSLKPEFRTPRSDLKASWFPTSRKAEKSIPATPSSEHPSRELAAPTVTTRSRSGSYLALQLNPSATAAEAARSSVDQKKKTVCLSKMIKIDVDPRKRSKRPEVVNLHYDRQHNPENCYHIELAWLNTTCKLVDDAILSWTVQAEKYGLKLVEVPLAQTYRIPRTEPFRCPYKIKLAVDPPQRPSVSHASTTNSLGSHVNSHPEQYIYEKALLRHFNFVLDMEARNEYPENVEIHYSWGVLDYDYTQYVHRSGIGLAQITGPGEIILMANRLYNARVPSARDTSAKFDVKKYNGHFPHRTPLVVSLPTVQASGLIGPNMQSPSLTPLSPALRATADVLGNPNALKLSTISSYVTPEQIKDEIEAFCMDAAKLEAFYEKVQLSTAPPPSGTIHSRRAGNGSTSSSLLRPIREPKIETPGEIPALELGESVASPSVGLGMSGFFKRARGSVMYDSVAEMFGGGPSSSSANNGPGRAGGTPVKKEVKEEDAPSVEREPGANGPDGGGGVGGGEAGEEGNGSGNEVHVRLSSVSGSSNKDDHLTANESLRQAMNSPLGKPSVGP